MSNYKTRLVVSLAVGLVTAVTFFTVTTAKAQAPKPEIEPTATTTTYVATPPKMSAPVAGSTVSTASLDEWINLLAEYESGHNPNAKVLDVNGKYSYGCLQFQMGTWLSYGADFGATAANIYDCDLQMMVAKDMITNQYSNWKHWGYTVRVRMGILPPK